MRLIDDIITFLESEGFGCIRQMRHGHEVICTAAAGSGDIRVILPIEINAVNLEEAVEESIATDESIRFITCHEEHPLIIVQDRWHRQRKMMEARLLAHLEVFSTAYARNCEIRRIEKSEAQEFLKENHSYGYAACRYRYGLFLKRNTGHLSRISGIPPGTLVAVATFSNARRWVKNGKEIRSYEWTRYATLPHLRLSGGMGKLLNAFISEIHPDDIMSYADLEWSEGKVYGQLGFRREGRKDPVSFVVDTGTWERTPIRPGMAEDGSGITERRFYCNFGSNKFRLKLTEYE